MQLPTLLWNAVDEQTVVTIGDGSIEAKLAQGKSKEFHHKLSFLFLSTQG